MAGYVPEVDSLIAELGLPPSLRYLPIIESGYSPTAVSPASAVGLWQLMAGTARGLGVRVTPVLDERRHPLASTEAALRFLDQLHRDFGSWFLALAAYNSGPARVRRLVRQHAPLEPPSDALYWRIRPSLPRETRDFVPKLFAAIRVGEAPEAFGHARPLARTAGIDLVEVPDATSLDVVARAASVPLEDVERLNPHVLRGFTPPDTRVSLRLPEGAGARFEEAYALIPPEERVTFLEHRVADGERSPTSPSGTVSGWPTSGRRIRRSVPGSCAWAPCSPSPWHPASEAASRSLAGPASPERHRGRSQSVSAVQRPDFPPSLDSSRSLRYACPDPRP